MSWAELIGQLIVIVIGFAIVSIVSAVVKARILIRRKGGSS